MKAFQEPIAIIGMGCRYPGIPDVASFWRVLHNAEDALSAPAGRRFSKPVSGGIGDLPAAGVGGLLEDVDCFDFEFFGMSPKEASCLDPQQRILLEVAWEAFEDAGLSKEMVSGARAGVFVGIWAGDFENTLYASGAGLDVHLITGVGRFPGPNRVSYALGLRGPSVAVDTACSSSLVAIHLACQSIRTGESEFALAGGVNCILRPEITEGFMRANMLAPDRRCKFGDISANGFVRSEGAGMVLLKPLAKAQEDGDPVYAVIRGSAVNNDGDSNGMLLHPSREGQERLLREAQSAAGVTPDQVQYVEAHGTGTSAGDPVEIEALSNVFDVPARQQPCHVGSVKTNIGHSEGAAGVAGLIKVALSLWHGEIPASLHFHEPNPKIAWRKSALAVQTHTAPWPESQPRIAGVSAFGLTGTNAHAVLEGVPEQLSRKQSSGTSSGRPYLVPLTAKSRGALDALARSYVGRLSEAGNRLSDMGDVAFTSAQRRTHHEERFATVVHGPEDFREKLDTFLRNEPCPGTIWGRLRNGPGKIAFVFPGQGAQWTGMGRQLFRDEPVFREEIERCHAAMLRLVTWSLLDLFTGSDPLPERIDVIQPSLFAMSAALSKLWGHWGVKPDAVVGHSMGEVAAAYVSGALSLADAATVICRRSALMCRVSGKGSMALVELSAEALQNRLATYDGLISIAASNSASSTVLSGETSALKELLDALQAEQTFCRFVKVDVASHSAYVDPIRGDLLEALKKLSPTRGSIPMYSTVTGSAGQQELLDADYWVRNLRNPVMFGRSIQQLIGDGFGTFIEISSHPLLVPSVQAGLGEAGREGLSLGSLKREEDERIALLSSAGSLFVAGHKLDWNSINGAGSCISLPNYPFQREHVWPDLPSERKAGGHAFLTPRIELASSPGTWVWDMEIGLGTTPFLADHRVRGVAVFPGAGYLELALAAAQSSGAKTGVVEDLQFHSALMLAEGSTRHVQVTFSPPANATQKFQITAREQDGSWTLLSDGRLRQIEVDASPIPESQAAILERCSQSVPGEQHYQRLAERGLQYGPSFQLVEQAWHSTRESFARIGTAKVNAMECSRHVLHPAVIDSALQAVGVLMPDADPITSEETYIPVSIERVRVLGIPEPGVELFAHAVRRETEHGVFSCDVNLLDSAGNTLLEISGFVCRALDRQESGERCVYELTWKERPIAATGSKPGSGQWMIFADKRGVSDRAALALEALGYSCVLVRAAESYQATGPQYDLNPDVLADYQRLLSDAGPSVGVLHLWGLDIEDADDASLESLDRGQRLGTRSIVLLTRALAEEGWNQPPRLWLGTSGLYDIGGSKQISVAQSPIAGLARVIGCEHPELRCASIDLSPAVDDEEIVALSNSLHAATSEDQIALRGQTRYSAHFANLAAPSSEPFSIRAEHSAYRVAIGEPGNLDSIGREEIRKKRPGPGEVSIKVKAAGLNFIDVLKSLGIYPGIEPGTCPPLGGECAGTVLEVGLGVENVRPGDAVVAVTPSVVKTALLASHVVVPSSLVVRKPQNLSWEEAAAIPLAYLTAWHGLHKLAGLRKGESVLIHAGTGGVGLAAIQLAQHAGARVFATAGNPEKRAYLKQLGIEGVFDSRSTAFVDEVLQATGSRGVDIVLNSLSGDLLEAGFRALGRYGRFVEIGKRDIYDNRQLGLGQFRRNLSFFAVDLAAMLEERRDEIASLLQELFQALGDGSLRPLPVQTFPASQATQMVQYMAAARHIGKLALTFDEAEVLVRPAPVGQPEFRADAGYLITGGLGGIALLVAHWMVENGARYMVLVGRRGPSEQAQAAIREMEALGATVHTVAADVSKPDEVGRILSAFGGTLPPLRGVMHAAAVVDDQLVVKLDPARIKPVMAPKAFGAWNLHRQTANMDLDFFVMFSSIAAVLPLPGHAAYAAANAFLDGLARYRRAQGKPGLSVNWGGWGGTGLALATGAAASIRGYAARGMRPFTGKQALDALGHLLGRNVACALAVPVDWRKLAAAYSSEGVPSVLASLTEQHARTAPSDVRGDDPVAQVRAAAIPERRELLESHIRAELSRVLRLSPSRIERDRNLGAMGLDSLMAVTFVRRLSASLGLLLPATTAFNYPTVAAVASHVGRKLGIELDAEAKPPQVAQPTPADLAQIENLSEEQAIAALISNGERE